MKNLSISEMKRRINESLELNQEALQLKKISDANKLVVTSDAPTEREQGQETFRNKNFLKSGGFKWDSSVNAWSVDASELMNAQKVINGLNKKEDFVQELEDIEEFIRSSDAPEKANLSDRIKLFIDDLANAVDERAADAKMKQYFQFFAKFKGHSFTNTILIFIQRPNATKVAGFRQWELKFNRRVKKGAKGIMIFAPITAKKGEEVGSDTGVDAGVDKKRVVGFKPVHVFDMADTEAMNEKGEIPESPQWWGDNEQSETADELYEYSMEVAMDLGITLSTSDSERGEKGYSAGDHINLSSDVAGVGRLSTMIHELAHELMHWKKSSPFYDEANIEANSSKHLLELQAESVSYIVLKHYDLDVQHHATYLAMWKANKEKIHDNIKIISNVAKFIIDKLDKIAESKHVAKERTEPVQTEKPEAKVDATGQTSLFEGLMKFLGHIGDDIGNMLL